MDAEAPACLIKQRFPNLPITLPSALLRDTRRILRLVDDYAMKSELPERLVPIIERARRRAARSEDRGGAANQQRRVHASAGRVGSTVFTAVVAGPV